MNASSRSEWMLGLVIAALVVALAVPIYASATEKDRTATTADAGRQLHRALLAYRFDHGKFPSEAELDVETLAPLTDGGYFRGEDVLVARGHDVTYLAPDVGGEDRQFVAVVRPREAPGNAIVVAHTDAVPHPSGWLDGVYAMDARRLEAVAGGSR